MNVNFLEAREIFEESLKVIVAGLREHKLAHKGPHYRFANALIEIQPKQKPNPPFWYGTSNTEGLAFAARHGMNIVAGGPNAVVNGVAQAYRQLREKVGDDSENLNPQVKVPIIGAVRHFFVADTDREAEEIARPAYKITTRTS
jgi:alkanesulfonate monooxygenase SsuD/methylene tetrahydromethanopterin reductase-like flavin-dependent oxidoreductase (luciferase family)